MFSIAVIVGPTVWSLLYRQKEAAETALETLRDPTAFIINLTDDFGQNLITLPKNIGGILFENTEESRLAHIERSLEVERIRHGIGTRMRADPVLKSNMVAASPAMLAPGMINGRMG